MGINRFICRQTNRPELECVHTAHNKCNENVYMFTVIRNSNSNEHMCEIKSTINKCLCYIKSILRTQYVDQRECEHHQVTLTTLRAEKHTDT